MNERIKQLRQKARDSAEKWVLRREEKGQYPTATEMQSKWDEKFAELIVKQVRCTVAENFHECRTASRMDKIIKEHFGVE